MRGCVESRDNIMIDYPSSEAVLSRRSRLQCSFGDLGVSRAIMSTIRYILGKTLVIPVVILVIGVGADNIIIVATQPDTFPFSHDCITYGHIR